MAETGYDSRNQREGTLAVIGDMGMYLFCSMVADIWLATGSLSLLYENCSREDSISVT